MPRREDGGLVLERGQTVELRRLSVPAWSAFTAWLLKLSGVPVARLRC
ncbi:hypothetical protein MYSTI_01619 [Myxococcus stipitatus DSM 14675]|uniref:Uncharacterized protein n=1 Tax=Myxococcus stipitatus (strain DSM 14675 / JCM 12634 / Mx s8) TaxID=1278073 RepID=L7U2G8_MYXSD|nr:hypothetical protein [Myxococcus stipitatus]AGC42951.1 hypothetical protein MYSTI_01619 [Myxococcus stipitatus DSM 14675]